jgi:hypothetical protein
MKMRRRKKRRRRRRTALVTIGRTSLLSMASVVVGGGLPLKSVAEVGVEAAEAAEVGAGGFAAGFPTRARRNRTEALVAGRGGEGEPLRISGGERLKT